MNNIPKEKNPYYPYKSAQRRPKSRFWFLNKTEEEEKKDKFDFESFFESIAKRPAFSEPLKSSENDVPTIEEFYKEKSTPTTAAQIKKDAEKALSENDAFGRYEDAFSDIDDETVEKNISVAQSAINNSIKRGSLKEGEIKNFPHLLSGLTMFYASAE